MFLAMAFAIQAFLMGTHTKHIPLDAAVHTFVFYTMVGCTVATLIEASFRRNIMLTTARSFFVILQGGWLCMAARILFEGVRCWLRVLCVVRAVYTTISNVCSFLCRCVYNTLFANNKL